MRFLQTLLAFFGGAVAALVWLDRQTSSERTRPARPAAPSSEEPERVVEPVVQEVVVPDPEQAMRIEALEAELAEQRTRREAPPDEPPPSVDAIRAARARAFELERQLSEQRTHHAPRWSDIEAPQIEALVDAVAEHLPLVSVRGVPDSADPALVWSALGALHEFADACGADWFEFHGDFARWCEESGHPDALPGDRLGIDDSMPRFAVDSRINRSGELVVPRYIQVGAHRLHYVDDVAGETGRMHVAGLS